MSDFPPSPFDKKRNPIHGKTSVFKRYEGKKMEWISLEEDLPEPGKIVLVADALNDFVSLGRLIEGEEENEYYFSLMNIDNVEIDSLVTHWMPLPEPPKE